MSWIVTLIVGGIIGWLASIVMKTNEQMGIVANVIVGIVGSSLGYWLAGVLGFTAHGFIARLVVAIAGAAVLIFLLKALRIFKQTSGGKMKRCVLAIWICVGITLLLSSCSAGRGRLRNAPAPQQPEYSLRLNLKPGQKFVMTTDWQGKQEFGGAGSGDFAELYDNMVDVYVVQDLRADGSAILQLWNKQTTSYYRHGQEVHEFDSTKTEEQVDLWFLNYAALIDVQFQILLSPQGETIKVFDTSAMTTQAVENAKKIADGADFDVDYLKASTSAEYLADCMALNIPRFPEKPLSVGSTWSFQWHSQSSPPRKMDTDCTLLEANQTEYLVKCTDIYTLEPERPVKMLMRAVCLELDRIHENFYTFDRDTGWLVRSNRTMTIHSRYQLENQDVFEYKLVLAMRQTWMNRDEASRDK